MLSLTSYMNGLGNPLEPLSIVGATVYIGIVVVVCITLIIQQAQQEKAMRDWREADQRHRQFVRGKW